MISQALKDMLDDLMRLGRKLLNDFESLLHPRKRERQPARVPVPIRKKPQQPTYDND